MSIMCTGKGVDVFRLLSLRGRVSLESKGLKFRGGSARLFMARELGLKGRPTHAVVMAAIDAKIAAIRAEFTGGEIVSTDEGQSAERAADERAAWESKS